MTEPCLLVGLDGVHVLRWPPVDSTSAKDLVGAGRGRGPQPARPEADRVGTATQGPTGLRAGCRTEVDLAGRRDAAVTGQGGQPDVARLGRFP